MEPGVPFALLGAVEILLVVAAVGLAGVGALRRSTPGTLVALGGLILAVVEVRTALRLGVTASDDLLLARATGAVLLGAGLYTGGLGKARLPSVTPGVVLPLAGAGGPAGFAATTFVLAGVAALASRRDAVGRWIAGGLTLWGAAAAIAPLADSGQGWPLTLVLLRGAGALAVCLALTLMAQHSLLTKVVGAILAGVVAMAIAAVGVVGSVVVSSYDTQARDSVRSAALSRVAALTEVATQATGEAQLAQQVCRTLNCQVFLTQVVPGRHDDFLVLVRRGQPAVALGGRPTLTPSELLGIESLPAVTTVLNGKGAGAVRVQADTVRLTGAGAQLAVIGVASVEASRPTPDRVPGAVVVYGERIDDPYTQNDVDLNGGFGLSFLAGDPLQVVASNITENEQRTLLHIVAVSGAADTLPADGVTIGSQGSNPTVALRPVTSAAGTTVALLAMTRDPGPALKTERDALRLLLVTAGLALVLVAVAASVLGRRTVEPVRRLTAAARRVAAGDLQPVLEVRSRDEVGTLASTFGVMTESLARLTGDLRDAAGRLETVLSSMTDGLLATDASGTVTAVNPAALAMLGVDETDVLGEPLAVVADVRDLAGTPLVSVDRELHEEPAEVYRPDGSRLPVRVALGPLTDAEGVVLVLRDTRREREVERMKTEFLSNVSHELRTPLTPIRGYAELLVSKPGLDADKVQQFATTIRDESLKMNRVVDLLVDVASIEAGRVQVSPRETPVTELLEPRLLAWQARTPTRAKDLKKRVARGLPPVHVDPTWVGKALDELLDNAVKYTSAGTAITLTAAWSPDGSAVRVSVKDTGKGISLSDQARLFTPFEQVDGSSTRKVGGLGLGLSFVRRLAQDAGFPLTMTSVPGKGSEFALDLPVAP